MTSVPQKILFGIMMSSITGVADPTSLARQPQVYAPFGENHCGCPNIPHKSWKCENFKLKGILQGAFVYDQSGSPQLLISAPHGAFDINTDKIVANIAEQNLFNPALKGATSRLIAHSFRGHCNTGFSYNVNRPTLLNRDQCDLTEKEPGILGARQVYRRFADLLDTLSKKMKPTLYVEIHGHNDNRVGERIEIATSRLSNDQALAIKERFLTEQSLLWSPSKPQATNHHPQANHGLKKRIAVDIDPIDRVFFKAGRAKQCGSIEHLNPTPVIHIELPLPLRTESQWRRTTAYLAKVLSDVFAEIGGVES